MSIQSSRRDPAATPVSPAARKRGRWMLVLLGL
ncbi:cytochrome C oxidase subunit I, partial [Burkholderia multivorans]